MDTNVLEMKIVSNSDGVYEVIRDDTPCVHIMFRGDERLDIRVRHQEIGDSESFFNRLIDCLKEGSPSLENFLMWGDTLGGQVVYGKEYTGGKPIKSK